ncbi:hypothetical protein POM88_029292 [Heracleum sosnowskyi]|uniref:Secreted protein n=1 Tax=Heracleum sosnowskyi TaxID=360622 RepID=A0AAD8MHJ4_9APIA|nr:hypothetical protein POM88_029292 [Heracleum sosnowskyi]
MIFIASLLALMVVTVTRRGAANGSGRGNRGGRGNGARGNDVEDGRENDRGHGSGEDANRIPLATFFERADRSVSTGHYPNVPLEGQPNLGIVSFMGKYINENIQKKTLKAIARDRWPTGAVDRPCLMSFRGTTTMKRGFL